MDEPGPRLTGRPADTPRFVGRDPAGPAGPRATVVDAAVRAFLAAHVPPESPLLVACSGGADSLALAIAVAAAAPADRVAAVTVDHRLQPGSADRAARTVDVLRAIGYADVAVLTVRVDRLGGLEAAARRARYAALTAHAGSVALRHGGPPVAVLLGHTLDDQAETVLLGLARGSGPRSVAGMRSWRPPWGRPLLAVSRADTESVCRRAGLEPWADPHNADPAFTRARLRHEVLPLLDGVLGGGVRGALARTAELMADDLDALDALAERAHGRLRRDDGGLDAAGLADLPPAVRRRVLRRWVGQAGGGPLTFDHLSRLDRLAADPRGPSQVRLPGAFDVTRDGATIRIGPAR